MNGSRADGHKPEESRIEWLMVFEAEAETLVSSKNIESLVVYGNQAFFNDDQRTGICQRLAGCWWAPHNSLA